MLLSLHLYGGSNFFVVHLRRWVKAFSQNKKISRVDKINLERFRIAIRSQRLGLVCWVYHTCKTIMDALHVFHV